jgi:hypothetical protein
VAATYDDAAEANDHTDFLNGLLATVRKLDTEAGNTSLMDALRRAQPPEAQSSSDSCTVSYSLVAMQVLSGSPLRPAGTCSAIDQR